MRRWRPDEGRQDLSAQRTAARGGNVGKVIGRFAGEIVCRIAYELEQNWSTSPSGSGVRGIPG